MKITVLQQNLQTALKTVQKVVPSKPQLPILSSVLLSTNNGKVFVAATDLYLGMKSEVAASVQEEGSVALPGKIFAEAILSLSGGKITLELQGNSVLITSDSGASFTIPAQSASEYPDFPEKDGDTYTLSIESLKKIDGLVGFAAALDQARLVLTTVLLEPVEGGARAVSTDGFRLSILKISELADLPNPVLIPSKALSEVARLADSQSQTSVDCSFSESLKQVFFRVGQTNVYARMVDGDFPPYQKIVPSVFTTQVSIDADELTQHLKQAAIFARDVSHIVQFSFTPETQQMTISAKGSLGSYESTISLESIELTPEMEHSNSSSTEPVSIAFNVKYIQDFLQAQKSDQIWFGMSEALKPALFKPSKEDVYQYVVMPFRMNG